jgi:glycerol uptake facilitator-like aquaporin
MPARVRQFVAEFLGTFAIVFVVSAAIMMGSRVAGPTSLLMVASAYAFTIAAMMGALANTSAHFNPGITIAFVATRRTGALDGAVKVAAQLCGAAVAGWMLEGNYPAEVVEATRVGGTQLALDLTFSRAVLLEAVATALMMIVVCGVSTPQVKAAKAGIAVGFVVAALVIAIGPLTGGSLNPARSFGPALASGIWEGHLAYWFGPIAGAVVGALVFDFGVRDRGTVTA